MISPAPQTEGIAVVSPLAESPSPAATRLFGHLFHGLPTWQHETKTGTFAIMSLHVNTMVETEPMKAIELVGDIDEHHRLRVEVPADLPAGRVRLIVLLPDEDDADNAWAHGVAMDGRVE
jgi:hypothetical protein